MENTQQGNPDNKDVQKVQNKNPDNKNELWTFILQAGQGLILIYATFWSLGLKNNPVSMPKPEIRVARTYESDVSLRNNQKTKSHSKVQTVTSGTQKSVYFENENETKETPIIKLKESISQNTSTFIENVIDQFRVQHKIKFDTDNNQVYYGGILTMKPLQINNFVLGNISSIILGHHHQNQTWGLGLIHPIVAKSNLTATSPNIFFANSQYSKVSLGVLVETEVTYNHLRMKPSKLDCKYSFKSSRVSFECGLRGNARTLQDKHFFVQASKFITWARQNSSLFERRYAVGSGRSTRTWK
jgi:hypothetical protein